MFGCYELKPLAWGVHRMPTSPPVSYCTIKPQNRIEWNTLQHAVNHDPCFVSIQRKRLEKVKKKTQIGSIGSMIPFQYFSHDPHKIYPRMSSVPPTPRNRKHARGSAESPVPHMMNGSHVFTSQWTVLMSSHRFDWNCRLDVAAVQSKVQAGVSSAARAACKMIV